MTYKKLILCLNLALIGCTGTPPGTPEPTSTPNPIPTVTSSPVPVATPSVSPTPTAEPSPDVSITEKGLLLSGKGYVHSPDTAFLVTDPFELEMEFSVNELKNENQTLFALYDKNVTPSKSHYTLSFENNSFFIKGFTQSREFSHTFSFNDFQQEKAYKLRFIVENKLASIFINDNKVTELELDDITFIDKNGTRVLNIGADSSGQNMLSAGIKYLAVKNVFSYSFERDLSDSGNYGLTASGVGDYQIGSPAPSTEPTPLPTPVVSATPAPEATNRFVNKYSIPLNINKKESEIEQREVFTSPGFILGESRYLFDNADIRFITEIIKGQGYSIRLAGNENVYVIDIGERKFDGVSFDFLKNKVDYSLENQYYSDTNRYSPVFQNHVYAIKTQRYGEEPRYAKLEISEATLTDYVFSSELPYKIDFKYKFYGEGKEF